MKIIKTRTAQTRRIKSQKRLTEFNNNHVYAKYVFRILLTKTSLEISIIKLGLDIQMRLNGPL